VDLSFIKLEDLKFLFVSSDNEDFKLANDILEQKEFDIDDVDKIIDELNLENREWHFFMKNCRITRTAKKSKTFVIINLSGQ